MSRADPFDQAILLPERPSARLHRWCPWQGNKEYGFPREAIYYAAAAEKPYSMVIGEESCAGVCPLHIL